MFNDKKWNKTKDKCTFAFQIPGKPCPQEVRSSSVNLIWEKSAENVDHYQIRYKCLDKSAKWKFFETDSNQNSVTLSGLMANTKYIFQVRGIFGDIEGPYGPESESIWTRKSLATDLLDFSFSSTNSNPKKYIPPTQEILEARNPSAKTRHLIIGILFIFIFRFIPHL